ncbi:hypothetical protein [Clostridium diolis]|uniref:Uncharacterized protein n=1 Tax=Clostridium diolis TaxID=223919 RepID=A0AAV3VV93_9CLOT|nr:hypothetical protein [Clostridium diolis]QES75314.1 hypothetical protein F3K33_21930 [Clostridium diolis]GEA29292.1 hypothetical protein CDIOL_02150 [Clostridium diolis]
MDKFIMDENNSDIITNLIELIEEFSAIIYKLENSETYKLLMNIIDKLDLIINLKSICVLENDFKIHIDKLKSKLPELLEAFENNDKILISDILKYDIKPLLERII